MQRKNQTIRGVNEANGLFQYIYLEKIYLYLWLDLDLELYI